jgi:hypothetical protein
MESSDLVLDLLILLTTSTTTTTTKTLKQNKKESKHIQIPSITTQHILRQPMTQKKRTVKKNKNLQKKNKLVPCVLEENSKPFVLHEELQHEDQHKPSIIVHTIHLLHKNSTSLQTKQQQQQPESDQI